MDSLLPVDVAAVADAVEAAAGTTVGGTIKDNGDNSTGATCSDASNRNNVKEETNIPDQPPMPLPRGWIMKESRSSPQYFYYYNMDTGISTWESPAITHVEQVADRLLGAVGGAVGVSGSGTNGKSRKEIDHHYNARTDTGAGSSRDKDAESINHRASKRQRTTALADNGGDTDTSSSSSSDPTEVRVLHILKKHVGSRRPSSWRNSKITSTKEEAHEELEGLLEILREEESDLTELRATFEELARTESDCSSAKRGGDLGYFGRKKMQPEFEKEAFRLNVGELTTDIVDTKSGSHILLRIG